MPPGFTKKYLLHPFILYALVTVAVFASLGLVQRIAGTGISGWYSAAQACALALGILHLFILYRVFHLLPSHRFGQGLLFIFALLLLSAAGIAILYHFLGLDYAFVSFLLPFFVPFLCWQAYLHWEKIPHRNYKLWRYPLNEQMPDLDMIDLSRIEVVQFVFTKTPLDPTRTSFTSKAPLNMDLGQLFFIFINDYNEKNRQQTIAYSDAGDMPYGWVFFRKRKWFGRKHYFDPHLSFQDNGILPNESIYAVRDDA